MDAPSYYCLECCMAFLWYMQGVERPNYCPGCGAYACIVPGESHNGYEQGRVRFDCPVRFDSPASKSSEVKL